MQVKGRAPVGSDMWSTSNEPATRRQACIDDDSSLLTYPTYLTYLTYLTHLTYPTYLTYLTYLTHPAPRVSKAVRL